MRCPFCEEEDSKVIDSRLTTDGHQVRRRRECPRCKERFTTFETAEVFIPHIIKNSGNRQPFDMQKLRKSFMQALEKRPVSTNDVEYAIQHIMSSLRATGEREVSSKFIGDLVLNALKKLDKVAYVRFASVYLSFDDIAEFTKEIEKLRLDNS
ncbi:transcriptional regulator NrdR [Vespertiliibacter pulmonis]|uniref:Transcriptional repressor NrdR n=1 Tax=Vespertiliibacter pulmonis TaxID=1443036 RepID=A0A3N4VXN2_9PAST|nr:transcriptional regulator NrdR [Vespertiliibacter pulmonis]QLB21564.1 transcriptional regulator NrdR [Vespertiliibacter pulmonis]RPE85985.1 transcriptional repressor NrdR [Vespertiliibacter pulmonis]